MRAETRTEQNCPCLIQKPVFRFTDDIRDTDKRPQYKHVPHHLHICQETLGR